MGKPTGFLLTSRELPRRRPVELRLRDWREVYEPQSEDTVRDQASRCMDCGIPFCHYACPLGNLIPEWNDLVYQGDFDDALERLHATNNFPEFTGRLCPAPCESACVVGIAGDPVTIERVEYEIIEHGFARSAVTPRAPLKELFTTVAIVGSGPAGLTAAQQLRREGYAVTVFERDAQIGGLLRFGIPEFKMEKSVIDRRLDQMSAEGVIFRPGVTIGQGEVNSLEELRRDFDAVLLAVGSTRPRDLSLPGRELAGIYFAMEYLKSANEQLLGAPVPQTLHARDRNVVILGGGDTGADCLGTVLRQGAASVTQLEIMERPPATRVASQPWPTMPLIFKVTSAHEEGGVRDFAVETTQFLPDGNGRVRALLVSSHNDASGEREQREMASDLVLLAAGFEGPELNDLSRDLSLPLTARATLLVDENWECLAASPGTAPVFACGDAVRGQSLIVWALAEGRSAAAAIDRHFRGATSLPAPLAPYAQPWE